jgi:hypothetical protein
MPGPVSRALNCLQALSTVPEPIRAYNRQAKQFDEPRLRTHLLSVKSPWLNPIEPHWLHAKCAICQPDGELSVEELRLCLTNENANI